MPPRYSGLLEEINQISNEVLRYLVIRTLDEIPNYFYLRESSSSGKYHPSDEQGLGGLVLHTKRVYGVSEILMDAWAPPPLSDAVRAACLLHDICRYGSDSKPSGHSLWNHPKLSAAFFRRQVSEQEASVEGDLIGVTEHAIISSHGRWGTVVPKTKEDFIVHLSDVVAAKCAPLLNPNNIQEV